LELIINPTNKCNFDCTFCSAHNISKGEIDRDRLYKYLKCKADEINIIIFNGGDPLMMDPDFYYKILDITQKYDIPISLTTNLLDFYNHPDKWTKLFMTKNVGVITSYNHNSKSRRLKNGTVYDQNMFIKVINLFYDKIGYKPSFISVIEEENSIEKMKDTVLFAKVIGTTCKLNKVLQYGKQTDYYPRYRFIAHYTKAMYDLINQGIKVERYETNFRNIHNFFNNKSSCCPLNRRCHNSILCINTDFKFYPCANMATNNKLYEKYNTKTAHDFSQDYQCIKNDCVLCDQFNLCNSCRSYVEECIRNQDTQNYCLNMNSYYPYIRDFFIKYKIEEI
jgi:MoaA/NifB/PqqE/SkfB family radical SAM enzyme